MEIAKNNNRITKDKNAKETIGESKGPIRRGELAKKLLIRGENARKFEAFRAKIEQEIPVYTEVEKILREKFIFSAWKLERATEVEKNILNSQQEQGMAEINNYKDYERTWGGRRGRVRNLKKVRLFSQELDHIMQYQIDTEKAMQKALERLREEQKLHPIHKTNGK